MKWWCEYCSSFFFSGFYDECPNCKMKTDGSNKSWIYMPLDELIPMFEQRIKALETRVRNLEGGTRSQDNICHKCGLPVDVGYPCERCWDSEVWKSKVINKITGRTWCSHCGDFLTSIEDVEKIDKEDT